MLENFNQSEDELNLLHAKGYEPVQLWIPKQDNDVLREKLITACKHVAKNAQEEQEIIDFLSNSYIEFLKDDPVPKFKGWEKYE